MNPFTHAVVAREIHQYLETGFQINIPIKTFIWGNMKPDFTKNKKLHYINKSNDEIKKMYDELNKENYNNIKDYTLKLGEFFHYISDFFCYAHSIDYFQENLSEHFLYEIKAHKKVNKFKGFYENNKELNNRTISSGDNLIDYLLYYHKRYLKVWNKTESDFIFTFKLIPMLLNNIIINNSVITSAL